MPLFSRSSNSNSSSSTISQTRGTQRTQGSKIPTMITERNGQRYAGDPRDMDIPAFTRRGSYYTAEVDQQEYKHLQASDVRRQVQQAPARLRSEGRYPAEYFNRPPQDLSAQPPYREYPITPSPRNGSAPSNYRRGVDPGPVRAFYNNGDRSKFDVGYHDSTRAPTAPRNGREHPSTPYTLATYHPAPTYTDVRTVRRY